MIIIKHTVKTTASPSDIWKIWEDVPNWKTWDHGIEFSTIDGPFVSGTTGTLKPKGGPLVHTTLSQVEPLKGFVDHSKLFLAQIIVKHFMTTDGEHTFVTHEIEMKGPLAFFFSIVIGRTMKKNLPDEMLAMVKKAETLSKTKKYP